MITVEQIKEKLKDEKDPFQYIDGEIARCANQMSDMCENVQDTIFAYNHRTNENDGFDLEKIKEDLKNIGELYMDINAFIKVRKVQARQQKRTEQVNRALVKRQEWMDLKNRRSPDE